MRLRLVVLVAMLAWLKIAAASLPVIDWVSVQNLLRNYHVLKQQLSQLQDQYRLGLRQADSLDSIRHTMQGHYGYGALMDDAQQFKQRLWSPHDWQSLLNGLAGGNPRRYRQLQQLYRRQYPILSDEQYQQGSTRIEQTMQQRDRAANEAAVVNTSYAYDTIEQHIATIHRISAEIDATVNTKAAIDLNSRLLAELAYVHAQELKMQVFLNQQVAQSRSDNLSYRQQAVAYNAQALKEQS